MKMYVKPEMEISKFDVEDVITTSSAAANVMKAAGFGDIQNVQAVDVSSLMNNN